MNALLSQLPNANDWIRVLGRDARVAHVQQAIEHGLAPSEAESVRFQCTPSISLTFAGATKNGLWQEWM